MPHDISQIDVTFALAMVGVVQAIFGIVYILSAKEKTHYNKVLSLWLFFLALSLLTGMIQIFRPEGLVRTLIKFQSFPYTFGPLFYFYAKLLTHSQQKFRKKDLLHFIPFIIFGIVDILFAKKFLPVRPHYPSLTLIVYKNICVVLFIVYIVFVIRILKQHRIKLKEYFSFETNHLTLHWIPWITVVFILHFIILSFFPLIAPKSVKILPPLLHNIVFVMLIFALSYFGFRQRAIETKEKESEPKKEEYKKQQYKKSGLTDDDATKKLTVIRNVMEKKRPYLDPSLTIQSLAEMVNIPKHHITQILNTKLNKNFYVFVNEYRVDEVKRQMKEDSNSNFSLLGIALDAEFNSKSGFNSAFKKVAGCTPSEFRKIMVNS